MTFNLASLVLHNLITNTNPLIDKAIRWFQILATHGKRYAEHLPPFHFLVAGAICASSFKLLPRRDRQAYHRGSTGLPTKSEQTDLLAAMYFMTDLIHDSIIFYTFFMSQVLILAVSFNH